MRVLVVSRCPPVPLHYGDRLIVHHLLLELRARGHVVDVLALSHDSLDPDLHARAAGLCESFQVVPERRRGPAAYVVRHARLFPARAGDCWHPALWQAAERRLSQQPYDVVHLFGGIQVYELRNLVRPWPNLIAPYESHSLFMEREARHAPTWHARLRARAELAVTNLYERRMYDGYDRVVVLTDADRRALLERRPSLPVVVIPNGVRTSSTPAPAMAAPPVLAFVGNFAYPPNVDAAMVLIRDVRPSVRRQIPDIRVRVIGPDPPEELRALARDDVELTGWVPDVGGALSGAACLVAPLWRGAGMKNKILDAMAAGVPVVTTPMGADGLDVTDGRHVLEGRTPEELAAAAIRIIRDPLLRASLVTTAQDFVRTHHAWSDVGARYKALYRAIIAGRTGA